MPDPTQDKPKIPSFDEVMGTRKPPIPSFNEVMGEKKNGGINGVNGSNVSSRTESISPSTVNGNGVQVFPTKENPTPSIKGNPTVYTFDGTPLAVNANSNTPFSYALSQSSDALKSLQQRVLTGNVTDEDLNVLSAGNGKSTDVIKAYVKKGSVNGSLVDAHEKNNINNQFLKQGIQTIGDASMQQFNTDHVLSDPDAASKFLSIAKSSNVSVPVKGEGNTEYEMFAAGKLGNNQPMVKVGGVLTPKAKTGVIQNPQVTIDNQKRGKQLVSDVVPLLVNKISEQTAQQVVDGTLSSEDAASVLFKRVDPENYQKNLELSNTDPTPTTDKVATSLINATYLAKNIIGAITNSDEKNKELLNAQKVQYELKLNQGMNELATNMMAEGVANNNKEQLDKANLILPHIKPDEEIIQKSPILMKQEMANYINQRAAKEAGLLEGTDTQTREGAVIKNTGVNSDIAKKYLTEGGYFNKVNFKDYANDVADNPTSYLADNSTFGGIGMNFFHPFVSIAKGLADLSGANTRVDRAAEVINDQMFPSTLTENIKPDFKVNVLGKEFKGTWGQTFNSVASLGGYIAGSYLTGGVGKAIGASEAAIARASAFSTFGLDAVHPAIKEAEQLGLDTPATALYTALKVAMMTEGGRILEAPFQKRISDVAVPGMSEDIAKVAMGLSNKNITEKAGSELLDNAFSKYVNTAKKYGLTSAKAIADYAGQTAKGAGVMSSFGVGDKLIKVAFGDPNAKMEDILPEAAHAYFDGLLTMGIIGSFGLAKDMGKNSSFKAGLTNVIDNHDAAKDVLTVSLRKGLLTEDQYNERVSVINTGLRAKATYNDAVQKIGVDLTPNQRSTWIANATAEKVLRDQSEKDGVTETDAKKFTEQADNLAEQNSQIFNGLKFSKSLDPQYDLYNAKQELEKAQDQLIKSDTPENQQLVSDKRDVFDKLNDVFDNGKNTQGIPIGDNVPAPTDVTVESAVIDIKMPDGEIKTFTGKNHAQAILEAQAQGADISQVDRSGQGEFKLSDGTIINRQEAKNRFGQDRAELLIPQDEAAKQANKDYKNATAQTETDLISQAKDLVNADVVKGYSAEILKDAANNKPEDFKSHLSEIAQQAHDVNSVKTTVNTYGQPLVDIATKLFPKEANIVLHTKDNGENITVSDVDKLGDMVSPSDISEKFDLSPSKALDVFNKWVDNNGKPDWKPVEGKLIVEPDKPISEMNSEELGDYASKVRKALDVHNKEFANKTEAEKEKGGYYDFVDNVPDLREIERRLNFIENSEDLSDLASSAKSTLLNIKDKPDEYDMALLNGIRKKAEELNIPTDNLVKEILKKVGKDYKDESDAKTMMESVLDKIIPKQDQQPTDVPKVEQQPTIKQEAPIVKDNSVDNTSITNESDKNISSPIKTEQDGKTINAAPQTKGQEKVESKTGAEDKTVPVISENKNIGKYEAKAREAVDNFKKKRDKLPSWIINKDPNIKGAGLNAESLFKILDNATIEVGKLMDTGVEFADAIKRGADKLIDDYKKGMGLIDAAKLKPDFEKQLRDGFEQHYKDNVGVGEGIKSDAGKGNEPPIGEVKVAAGEGNTIGIRHVDTAEMRQELSLPEYQKEAQTLEDWNAEADARIKKGELPSVIEKFKEGSIPSKVEQVIMGKYIAELGAKARETMSDKDISALHDAVKLSDKVGGSEAGASLRARQIQFVRDDSLEGFILAKMESNAVDKLTDKQKADVKKQHEDYKKASGKWEAEKKRLEAKVAKLEAEKELKKVIKAKGAANKTHEDYVTERNTLRDKLRAQKEKQEKYLADQHIQKAGFGFTLTPEMAKTIGEIVKSHVFEIGNKLGEVTKRTFDDVKDVFGGITEKDIHDVIAGKYNEPQKTRSEIMKNLVDLKVEAKLINELDALENGEAAKPNASIVKAEGRISELRIKIQELKDKAKLKKELTDLQNGGEPKPTKKSTPKGGEIGDLRKSIEDLKIEKKLEKELKELENGVRRKRADKKEVERNRKIFELKRRIQDLKKTLPDNSELLAAKKKSLAKQIKQVQDDINNKRFAPEKKQPAPIQLDKEATDAMDELIRVKNERHIGLLREQYEATKGTPMYYLKGAANILNLPRSLMSSADFSAVLRQAIIPTISHPTMAFSAGKAMFESSFSQKAYDRWFFEYQQSPRYKLIEQSKLGIADSTSPLLTIREEAFMSNLAERIPIFGTTLIKGSERAYTMFLNKMRVDLFNRFADSMEARGLTFENSPEQYKQMANYVNSATGRGDLGNSLNKIAPLLNSLFFSPRLIASRLNMLTYFAQPRFYKTVPKEVRQSYFTDMGKFVSLGLTVLALASLNKDNKTTVESNPTSSDFGKIRNGDTRWDIWGGFQQYIRIAAQAGFGERTSNGKTTPLGEKSRFGETRLTPIIQAVRGKLAPVPSMAIDIFSGRTQIGDKIVYEHGLGKEMKYKEMPIDRYVVEHLLPLTFSGMVDSYKDQGVKSLGTVLIPSLFGIGVQTYSSKKKSSGGASSSNY